MAQQFTISFTVEHSHTVMADSPDAAVKAAMTLDPLEWTKRPSSVWTCRDKSGTSFGCPLLEYDWKNRVQKRELP